MSDEAKLVGEGRGLQPDGDGWFVLNAKESRWFGNELFGAVTAFESREHRFPQLGVNIHVLHPGKPACLYHRETEQEDFLVLAGEALLVIEEEERRLKAWDFVHCPPGTTHVFVGAGDGPCAILMMGARREGAGLHYPSSDVARRHGASVEEATDAPREAYAPFPSWEELDGPGWPP